MTRVTRLTRSISASATLRAKLQNSSWPHATTHPLWSHADFPTTPRPHVTASTEPNPPNPTAFRFTSCAPCTHSNALSSRAPTTSSYAVTSAHPAPPRLHSRAAAVQQRSRNARGALTSCRNIRCEVSKQYHTERCLALHFSRAKAAEKMVVGKGTPAFGQRNDKSHTLCRRCGKRSYHIQKKKCASCGFPSARIRHCKFSSTRPFFYAEKHQLFGPLICFVCMFPISFKVFLHHAHPHIFLFPRLHFNTSL